MHSNTPILTPSGYVPVSSLTVGSPVSTTFGTARKVISNITSVEPLTLVVIGSSDKLFLSPFEELMVQDGIEGRFIFKKPTVGDLVIKTGNLMTLAPIVQVGKMGMGPTCILCVEWDFYVDAGGYILKP